MDDLCRPNRLRIYFADFCDWLRDGKKFKRALHYSFSSLLVEVILWRLFIVSICAFPMLHLLLYHVMRQPIFFDPWLWTPPQRRKNPASKFLADSLTSWFTHADNPPPLKRPKCRKFIYARSLFFNDCHLVSKILNKYSLYVTTTQFIFKRLMSRFISYFKAVTFCVVTFRVKNIATFCVKYMVHFALKSCYISC